jgi:hypothetical protein
MSEKILAISPLLLNKKIEIMMRPRWAVYSVPERL